MIRNKAYDAHLSLAALNAQINEFEQLFGRVIGLGHQDGATIGVHDTNVKGGLTVLKPGGPIAVPGMAVAATGVVMIIGNPQTVTAYRAVAAAGPQDSAG
jgi:hypothetical protein